MKLSSGDKQILGLILTFLAFTGAIVFLGYLVVR